MANVVELGLLVIEAVAPLVPPVIVSAIENDALAATVTVYVPPGYSVIPVAKGIVVCSIVH